MKRTILFAGLSVLALGGCKSDDTASASGYQPYIPLSQFNPDAETNYYYGDGTVHLGAGDTLGREIFVNYLAQLHTEDGQREYFATVPENAERQEK
jgi:hypothetical protein